MRWLLVKAWKRSLAHRLSAQRKHIRLVAFITCSLRLSSPNTILGHTCLFAQFTEAHTHTIQVLHQHEIWVYTIFVQVCQTGWMVTNTRISCGPPRQHCGGRWGFRYKESALERQRSKEREMWKSCLTRVWALESYKITDGSSSAKAGKDMRCAWMYADHTCMYNRPGVWDQLLVLLQTFH